MNYEIERELSGKADKWELHNIHNENRELKSHINELEKKISNLENTNRNQNYVLERFFNILAEHPQFSDISNQIYEL